MLMFSSINTFSPQDDAQKKKNKNQNILEILFENTSIKPAFASQKQEFKFLNNFIKFVVFYNKYLIINKTLYVFIM